MLKTGPCWPQKKALASHEERTGTWPPQPVESDNWY